MIDYKARSPEKFTNSELDYWTRYGVLRMILDRFNVIAIDSFKTKTGHQIERKKDELIFGYQLSEDCIKIYKPLDKVYKFSWIGTKPVNHIFGFNQLPQNGNIVVITGGEKDVLSLTASGFNAITLNSETASISDELVTELRAKFKEILILYDNDDTGIEQSKKWSEKHRIPYFDWQNLAKNLGDGKDVSDYLQFTKANNLDNKLEVEINAWITKFSVEPIPKSPKLQKLLDVETRLKNIKSGEIKFSQSILQRDNEPWIYPNAIHVIQGKAATHKSRLAEAICSCFLSKNMDFDCLRFTKDCFKKYYIAYIDTERNLNDQYPYALKRILESAGYDKSDNPKNFRYTSLLEISRDHRMEHVQEFLGELTTSCSDANLIVFLDVLTDCMSNFNDPKESLELVDLLNKAINTFNVTFICVIHENPGVGHKARGHLGTELNNKATTVLQTSLVTNNESGEEAIQIDFLKCRNTKKHKPFYAEYDEEIEALVLADGDFSKPETSQNRSIKAPLDEVIKYLATLNLPMDKKTLTVLLGKKFKCSPRTMEYRLKPIIDEKMQIQTEKGFKVLNKEKQGNMVNYFMNFI